jgi:pyrrolidone-carboxylate peptidase
MPEVVALEDWVAQVAAILGVPAESADVGLLLDVARDAAHTIARPAAPLTTFLIGLAAGRAGGTPEDVLAAVTAARLALAAS